MNRPTSRYSPPPRPEVSGGGSGGGPAYATPIYNKEQGSNPPPPTAPAKETEDDNLDEFDDLTIEELRSLLDNFKNLSKGEQMDLIRYMKKLELTDPDKVKLLKQSVKPVQKPGTRYYLSNIFSSKRFFFIYQQAKLKPEKKYGFKLKIWL